MSDTWAILAMGIGVYALRLSGMALPDVAVPATWRRALASVPVAVLAALVVSSLASQMDWTRLVAAAGAGFIARWTGRMWACILSGMALYYLLGLA